MSYLLLAALAAFLLYLGLRWFVKAEPAQLAFVTRTLAIGIAVIVGLLLIITGRLGVLYILGGLGVPALMAWYRRRKAAAGGFGEPDRRQGGKSEIDTPWLRMELDLHNERIEGRVKQGRSAGRNLSDLDDQQLFALYRETSGDADTTRLLDAYLDRRLGSAWRNRQQTAEPARAGMSREEALEILGLAGNATHEEIRAAHRRLMSQLHPDKGGSTYLAAKINQARDFLLGD